MNERPIEDLLAETVAAAGPELRSDRADVFGHLIESDDDLVGIVAYSIYKREKRDWLARWETTRGEAPTDGEVEAFVLANLTEGQKERYRVAARTLLESYDGETLASSPILHADDASARRLEAAATRIEAAAGKRRGGGFWGHVLAGAIGAIVFFVIAAGISYLPALGITVPDWVPFSQP